MSARVFQSASAASRVTAGEFVAAYRAMLTARLFEEKMGALYRAGKIVGGVYLGRGQEAFSCALGGQLDRSSATKPGGGPSGSRSSTRQGPTSAR
jgi:pyruvate dehydrogenase E1 component alpha subunit/2-oxoisovalerate dehydrogenase E1 component alpha subunit